MKVLATSKQVTAAAIAALLALTASGCAGGSRSGSDQPGVEGPPGATAGPAVEKVSINESSEDDVAAALRRSDVEDPQGWAQIVVSYRPYPSGAPGDDRLRQVLVEHEADPAEVDKIMNMLSP